MARRLCVKAPLGVTTKQSINPQYFINVTRNEFAILATEALRKDGE